MKKKSELYDKKSQVLFYSIMEMQSDLFIQMLIRKWIKIPNMRLVRMVI